MFNQQQYIELRTKEGRIYSDLELQRLPYVDKTHPFCNEWKTRAASFDKLKNYLENKSKGLNILDLGCGNGWMTNRLSEIKNTSVSGVDLNNVELTQAQRIFESNQNIRFLNGNIFENIVDNNSFDVVVMAASVQYFEDLNLLINCLKNLLNTGGEIHIIDSHFYSQAQKNIAKQKSVAYYKSLGFEGFAQQYHHHTWNELMEFDYSVFNRTFSDRFKLKFLKDTSLIFPWVMIKFS